MLGMMVTPAASMGVQPQSSKYVASVTWTKDTDTTGRVVVTTTPTTSGLPADAADKTIEMRATGYTDSGKVEWLCRAGATNPMQNKYLPASCK